MSGECGRNCNTSRGVQPRQNIIAMQTKDPPKRGRPSDYSTEIGDAICDRLVEGESLRRIGADVGMPDKATIFRWITRHKEFRDQYEIARECQAEGLLDESLEVAMDSSGDFVKKVLPDGKVVLVSDLANIDQVIVAVGKEGRPLEGTGPLGHRVGPRDELRHHLRARKTGCEKQPPIRVAAVALPKSPVSLT
jgi:Bacteriophage Sf6, terminase small subunit-like